MTNPQQSSNPSARVIVGMRRWLAARDCDPHGGPLLNSGVVHLIERAHPGGAGGWLLDHSPVSGTTEEPPATVHVVIDGGRALAFRAGADARQHCATVRELTGRDLTPTVTLILDEAGAHAERIAAIARRRRVDATALNRIAELLRNPRGAGHNLTTIVEIVRETDRDV